MKQKAEGAGTLFPKAGSKVQKAPRNTGPQTQTAKCRSNAGQMHINGLYPFKLCVRWRLKLKSDDLLNLLVKDTYSNCSSFIFMAVYAL